MRGANGVRVSTPARAEDSLCQPLAEDTGAIPNEERILMKADKRPVLHFVTRAPAEGACPPCAAPLARA
jgi:hypothetical protein